MVTIKFERDSAEYKMLLEQIYKAKYDSDIEFQDEENHFEFRIKLIEFDIFPQ